MHGRRRRSIATLFACAFAFAAVAPAAYGAQEVGDAGELPDTAQDLGSETALDSIAGAFDGPLDHDVYRVCLAGGGTFAATTVGGSELDTQLFLFDGEGRGIYANDDTSLEVRQSTLPAGDPLTPVDAGVYLLGVAQYNQDPDSPLGPIFPNVPEVVGAAPPGSVQPLSAWTGRAPDGAGAYTVTLTGVVPCAQPDEQAPAVDLRTPGDGAVFALGETVLADYSCADEEAGSGLATCEGTLPTGAALDTSTPGPRTFSVTAVDNAGNETVATATYRVGFAFEGFAPPLVSPPELNVARAGARVVVAFGLDGFRGRDVLANGSPRSLRTSCEQDPVPDPGEGDPVLQTTEEEAADEALGLTAEIVGSEDEPDEAGAPIRRGPLAYDGRRDRYVFAWKTKRSWAGTCRELVVELTDGSEHSLTFRFRRSHGWPWGWFDGWGRDRDRDRDRDHGHDRDRDRHRGDRDRDDRSRDGRGRDGDRDRDHDGRDRDRGHGDRDRHGSGKGSDRRR